VILAPKETHVGTCNGPSLIGGFILGALLVGGGAGYMWQRAEGARKEAEHARAEADQARQKAEQARPAAGDASEVVKLRDELNEQRAQAEAARQEAERAREQAQRAAAAERQARQQAEQVLKELQGKVGIGPKPAQPMPGAEDRGPVPSPMPPALP
jgi:hypothetical protein